MNAISESALWKKRLGDWVLNPYIGCEHGCFHCYCPAMPGVKFFNGERPQSEWGKYILPKPGFVDALKRQLKTFTPDKAKRTEWGNGWLLMSFLTDCYTPREASEKITRQCLKLLLEAGHKVRVQTRSALVERDFDILKAHKDRVLLGTSLPYMDDKLARVLEPRATGPTRRLKMLQKAHDAGIPVYVAAAPFMPFTSLYELQKVATEALKIHAVEIFCEVLNPKGENLAMMEKVLADGGWTTERNFILGYDQAAWSKFTFDVLWQGFGSFAPTFVPWPDTQRQWKRHLTVNQVEFLDNFLPPKQ